MIQVIHHALDAKVFPHELLSTAAQALAQRRILSQLKQSFAQTVQIARPQQEPRLILQADLFRAIGIVSDNRPPGGQGLGQGTGQALAQ